MTRDDPDHDDLDLEGAGDDVTTDDDLIDDQVDLDDQDADDEFDDPDDVAEDEAHDDAAAAPGTPSAARSGAPTVGLQTLPVTGEPRVDDALGRLTDLASLPVDEHVGVFEDVQRRLHDTLADLSGQ